MNHTALAKEFQLVLPCWPNFVTTRQEALDRIEMVIDKILRDLQAENHVHVGLKSARIFKVLDILHDLITNETWITKRDLYYQDVGLFGKQTTLNACVDLVVKSLKIPREIMGVVGASKGLIKGNIEIWLKDGTKMMNGDLIIPSNYKIEKIVFTGPILIVEKEAIYQRLNLNCILVTGKGYPDYATLDLLQMMKTAIYTLVDGDVYGMEIYAMYKRHVPNCKLMGVTWQDWNLQEAVVVGQKDLQRGLKLLGRVNDELRREISKIIFSRCKVELEMLGDDLESWIEKRL